MKLSSLLIIVAITSLLLAGCASNGGTTTPASDSVGQAAGDVAAAGDLNQELDTSEADTTASDLSSLDW